MTGFFITGTDTNIGKTLFSAALLHACAALGRRALGMKPVAAGARQIAGEWSNDDVLALRAASSVSAPAALVNPYLLRAAIAPHIAADRQGIDIDLPRIRAAYEQLADMADIVVVEGVGGFRVPLSATRDSADLAIALGLPIILVVGMRLGCLNHALLSAEAIAARGLRLAGWVANRVEPDMPAHADNVATLARLLPAPLLAEFPYRAEPDPIYLASLIVPKKLSGLLDAVGAG